MSVYHLSFDKRLKPTSKENDRREIMRPIVIFTEMQIDMISVIQKICAIKKFIIDSYFNGYDLTKDND